MAFNVNETPNVTLWIFSRSDTLMLHPASVTLVGSSDLRVHDALEGKTPREFFPQFISNWPTVVITGRKWRCEL